MKTKFFDIAKRLSKKATHHHQLGAVIVKKNRPIGFGYNQPHKTHPKSTNKFKTIHAELDSILGLSYDELKGAEIYVYRETKDGFLATSKPCANCLELLKLAKIKKIHYTTYTGFKSEEF